MKTLAGSTRRPTPDLSFARDAAPRGAFACGQQTRFDAECAGCRGRRQGDLPRSGVNRTVDDRVAPIVRDQTPPIVHDLLQSPGRPLDSAARAALEPRFGHDFRRALIIGGVHNRTEPQGSAVVNKLKQALAARIGAGQPPFFTTILVPDLFATGRCDPNSERWIRGGIGRDRQGRVQASRSVEPNRNFPLPGEGLAAVRARGSSGSTEPELVFRDPANPSASPRSAQDRRGAGKGGTSIRMLPETRALIPLIEHFRSERIASVHAHSLKSIPGDAPGLFVDPRGVDPTTGAVTNAARAAEDDRLAASMVRAGRTRLGASPIAGGPSVPFVGNAAGTPRATVRYASGAHAEGDSLGSWAPVPVASGPGARSGITTVTIEVPQWLDASQAAQLDRIEALHANLLATIFLEDPAVVALSTGPATP